MLQIRSTAYELHSLYVFVLHLFCASLFQFLFTSSGPFLVLSAAGTSAFNNVGSLTTAIPSDSPDENRPKFSAPLASGSCVIHISNFLSLFQSSLSLSLSLFYLSSRILPASHLLLKHRTNSSPRNSYIMFIRTTKIEREKFLVINQKMKNTNECLLSSTLP